MIRICSQIRKFRKEKGLSQENMASDLGISQTAYTNLENGVTHLSVDRLMLIAHLLERDIIDFFPESLLSQETVSSVEQLEKKKMEVLVQENNKLHDEMSHTFQETIELLTKEIEVLQGIIDDLRR